MSKAYLQLGKIGDVIGMLPMLQHEFKGEKIPLIIAKEYAPVLDGVSFVEPIIWKGQVQDLSGAIMFAKKRFSKVVVTQTFGDFPIQHLTPSFQLDQWKRAGYLNQWEALPLTFDRRNHARELNVWESQGFSGPDDTVPEFGPIIIYADHSQSSPFMHKEELYEMLRKEFGPTHRIIRLSEVRAERIYDVLALMDVAACLVTIETAHLHLSRASKVPTIALAANGWRGSAFSTRFAFFMRYAEWSESRKLDLLDAVRTAIGAKGYRIPPKVEKMDTVHRNGYNLSHIEHEGKRHHCYRAHPNGDWKTRLFLDGDHLKLPVKYDSYSHEDLRFFEFNGKLHGVYVVSTTIDNFFRCYVAYGEIKGNEIDHIQIQHPENNLMRMTKNWTPFVHEGKLFFVYGISNSNQVVLQVDGDRVVSTHLAPAPTWAFGEIRGGCIVPHNGAYLRFFHSRALYSDKTARYFIGASIIEAKPPFKTLAVSKRPILQGDERYTPNCHHWKPNVKICYSVIKQGDEFLLSGGSNDAECFVATLKESDLNL